MQVRPCSHCCCHPRRIGERRVSGPILAPPHRKRGASLDQGPHIRVQVTRRHSWVRVARHTTRRRSVTHPSVATVQPIPPRRLMAFAACPHRQPRAPGTVVHHAPRMSRQGRLASVEGPVVRGPAPGRPGRTDPPGGLMGSLVTDQFVERPHQRPAFRSEFRSVSDLHYRYLRCNVLCSASLQTAVTFA